MKFRIDVKSKNVNNDNLHREIISVMTEAADDFIIQRSLILTPEYDYRDYAEYIKMYFGELLSKGKVISQFDVICDKRNNSEADARKCIVNISVSFLQIHCLNTTEIQLKIY